MRPKPSGIWDFAAGHHQQQDVVSTIDNAHDDIPVLIAQLQNDVKRHEAERRSCGAPGVLKISTTRNENAIAAQISCRSRDGFCARLRVGEGLSNAPDDLCVVELRLHQ